MNPVDLVLAELWQRMLPGDRRALALIGYCYTLERRLAADNFVPWEKLTTVDRMALIRAMYAIGELARDCARELQRADEQLQAAAHVR